MDRETDSTNLKHASAELPGNTSISKKLVKTKIKDSILELLNSYQKASGLLNPFSEFDLTTQTKGNRVLLSSVRLVIDCGAVIENMRKLLQRQSPAISQVEFVFKEQNQIWCIAEFCKKETGGDDKNGVAGFCFEVLLEQPQLKIRVWNVFAVGYFAPKIISNYFNTILDALWFNQLGQKKFKPTSSDNIFECGLSCEMLVADFIGCIKPKKRIELSDKSQFSFGSFINQQNVCQWHFGFAATPVNNKTSYALTKSLPIEILESKNLDENILQIDHKILAGHHELAWKKAMQVFKKAGTDKILQRRLQILGLLRTTTLEDLMSDEEHLLTLSYNCFVALAQGRDDNLLRTVSNFGKQLAQEIPGFEEISCFDLVLPELLGDAWAHKDFYKAMECYQRILHKRGPLIRIFIKQYKVADRYHDEGKKLEVLENIANCELLTDLPAQTAFELAEMYYANNLFERAEKLYLIALSIDRKLIEAATKVVTMMLHLKRPDQAVDFLASFIDVNRDVLNDEQYFDFQLWLAKLWDHELSRIDVARKRYKIAVEGFKGLNLLNTKNMSGRCLELAEICKEKLHDQGLVIHFYLELLNCGVLNQQNFEYLKQLLIQNGDYELLTKCYKNRICQIEGADRLQLMKQLLQINNSLSEEERDRYSLVLLNEIRAPLLERVNYWIKEEQPKDVERLIIASLNASIDDENITDLLEVIIDLLPRSSPWLAIADLIFLKLTDLDSQTALGPLNRAIKYFHGYDDVVEKRYLDLILDRGFIPDLELSELTELLQESPLKLAQLYELLSHRIDNLAEAADFAKMAADLFAAHGGETFKIEKNLRRFEKLHSKVFELENIQTPDLVKSESLDQESQQLLVPEVQNDVIVAKAVGMDLPSVREQRRDQPKATIADVDVETTEQASVYWRDIIRKSSVNPGLTKLIKAKAFSNVIEKHVALQIVGLLNGELSELHNWQWPVWRKSSEVTYPFSGRDRYQSEQSQTLLGGNLHRLVSELIPLLAYVFSSRFNLDYLANKFRLSTAQVIAKRKSLKWDHPIFIRSGLSRFKEQFQKHRYLAFHFEGLKQEIFFEGKYRAVYFDVDHYQASPPSHLFHRILKLTWSLRLNYFVPLHLDPFKDVLNIIMRFKTYLKEPTLKRVKKMIFNEQSSLEQLFKQLNQEQMLVLFSKQKLITPEIIGRLWQDFEQHIYKLLLTETLDVIGVFESISNLDFIDSYQLKPKEILSLVPLAEKLLPFILTLKL